MQEEETNGAIDGLKRKESSHRISRRRSVEQIKGKEIMQNSNSGKTNKETTYQEKSQLQLKHSKLAQQWRGKKQQQPKQVNNPIKETIVTFGKEISSVITEGDMEKEKSFTRLKKGDHSGKDKIVQHGNPPDQNNETNPQAKDSENPPLSKSASILEKEDHEQNLMNTNQHSEIQELQIVNELNPTDQELTKNQVT
ncbi:unnamed protein product [Ilex paraguariensis]|uniref:Uncharacterized protein n=1 Tax=Ilex paraguariensis TaxID=185542 RepID=A0ABC8RRS9_9AQUA